MENKVAQVGISIVFILTSIILVMLGIFWLFSGIRDDVPGLIVNGTLMVMAGAGIGALANFLKF